ncbi:hypothetical protein ACET3Z_031458 [Daucus carota]
MGLGSSEQRFVAVHEADLAPAVEDGVDAQAPMVDNDVQEGQEVLVGDGGVEIPPLRLRPSATPPLPQALSCSRRLQESKIQSLNPNYTLQSLPGQYSAVTCSPVDFKNQIKDSKLELCHNLNHCNRRWWPSYWLLVVTLSWPHCRFHYSRVVQAPAPAPADGSNGLN